MSSTPTPRHPKGLYLLFFTEMWERFGFYLMIGIFYQYLVDSQTGGLGWTAEHAASVVGSYLGLVYLTPFLGGILADRVLGYRVSIAIGGALLAAGYFMIAMPSEAMLFAGIGVLVLGNGLFKPNISTVVGNLYPAGSPLRDAGYNIFYLGINIGAFACNFVAALVRNKWGWHWAFATAGIGMIAGLIAFLALQGLIRDADVSPAERRRRAEASGEREASLLPLVLGCLVPAAALGALGWWLGGLGETQKGIIGLGPATTAFLFACLPAIGFFLWIWRSIPNVIERGRVAGLLAIYGVVVVFWMVFQQNATALTAWALHSTDRTPNAVMRPIINLAGDFAENAPPEYFTNAPAETPRPAKDSYRVVSDAEYKALEDKHALSVEDGKPVPVTAKMLADIYARATPATPTLPPQQQLKLVNTELFQSINPGFIILLTPLVVGFWSVLRRRGKEPTSPAKIGIGLAVTAGSALVMVAAAMAVDDTTTKASSWWLVGTYGMATVGELCLSPMGLSLVSKMSPARIRAFMMGGWFLSTAIGNKLSGVLGESYAHWSHSSFFLLNCAATGIAALTVFALLPWLRRQMNEQPHAHDGDTAPAPASDAQADSVA